MGGERGRPGQGGGKGGRGTKASREAGKTCKAIITTTITRNDSGILFFFFLIVSSLREVVYKYQVRSSGPLYYRDYSSIQILRVTFLNTENSAIFLDQETNATSYL